MGWSETENTLFILHLVILYGDVLAQRLSISSDCGLHNNRVEPIFMPYCFMFPPRDHLGTKKETIALAISLAPLVIFHEVLHEVAA